MNTALLEAIKEAYVSAPANRVDIHTIEVRQTGVQEAIFITQSRRDIIANDENGIPRTFRAGGFQFTLPPSNEEGFQSLTISIDNIGREVSDFITTAKGEVVPVEVIYRPYVSDNLLTPQMIPPLHLFLKDVQITTHQVTGRATFMDIVNKKFPAILYNRSRFPALG